jgi:hypothetical protein
MQKRASPLTRGYPWPISAGKLTLLSMRRPICQNGFIAEWYRIGMRSDGAVTAIDTGMDRDMSKEIRHTGALEFNHPIVYFLFVRPWIWLGKVWLQLLVHKHHLWAAFNPAFLGRLTWFGPARSPLHSRSAPILVLAGTAGKGSRQEVVGDYDPATERHD